MMPELTDLEIDQVEYITDTVCRAMVICGAQIHVIEYAMARFLAIRALAGAQGDRAAAEQVARDSFAMMTTMVKDHPYDQDVINRLVTAVLRGRKTVQ